MTVVISPNLIYQHVSKSILLTRAFSIIESDDEVQELLRLSNVFAVTRLKYNDHGPVHAKIVAGTALELLELLIQSGIKPSCLKDGTCDSIDEAKLIVLLAAYLHDIGNSVHRENHEFIGALLAKDILDRLLPRILPDKKINKLVAIRQEILHAIYSTNTDIKCLTIEAGVVKIADGLDMAEGRARLPYKLGKFDIHAVSALSIKKVEICKGSNKPIKIIVHMDQSAGIFQVEKVLMPKIFTSGLQDYIELAVLYRDKEILTYPTIT